MIKVSYITTIYNKAECISETIDSLMKQYGDFEREYIFVDDGSTDGSVNIIKDKIADIDNAILITQNNSGPSLALNIGIMAAKGEWLYLVDGDDYLMPDATINLLSAAETYKAKLIRAMHTNNYSLDRHHFDGKVTVLDNPLEVVLTSFPVGASVCIIERQLAQEIGGCDERIFVQDYSISLRAAEYTTFVKINKLLASNINNGQLRLSGNKLQENFDSALARFLFVSERSLPKNLLRIALRAQLRKTASWYRKTAGIFKFLFSKYCWRNFLVALGFAPSNLTMLQWMQESLNVFDQSKIRFTKAYIAYKSAQNKLD